MKCKNFHFPRSLFVYNNNNRISIKSYCTVTQEEKHICNNLKLFETEKNINGLIAYLRANWQRQLLPTVLYNSVERQKCQTRRHINANIECYGGTHRLWHITSNSTTMTAGLRTRKQRSSPLEWPWPIACLFGYYVSFVFKMATSLLARPAPTVQNMKAITATRSNSSSSSSSISSRLQLCCRTLIVADREVTSNSIIRQSRQYYYKQRRFIDSITRLGDDSIIIHLYSP